MAFAKNLRMPIPPRPRSMTEAEQDEFYRRLEEDGGEAARTYRDNLTRGNT